MPNISRVVVIGVWAAALLWQSVAAGPAVVQPPQSAAPEAGSFAAAQRRFYDGYYEDAAGLALALRAADPENLATYELRTSALLFQIKRLIGEAKDKDKAFKECEECPALKSALEDDVKQGLAVARAKLVAVPTDETARFFLGKLNLNYIWLHLGPLGKRTGWNEYWEARNSMDAVLAKNPTHVRARVARAWIEYIVDTKMPWGFTWILGGGNKKHAIQSLRAAAAVEADFFDKTEAGFALWEMQVRERNFPEAVVMAQRLATDFPNNRELIRFLAAHGPKR